MIFDDSERRLALYSSLISHFRHFRKKKHRKVDAKRHPQVIQDRVAAQPPRPLSGAKSQRSGLATPLCRSVFFQVRRRAAPRAQGPRVKGPFGPLGAIGGYSEAIPSGWPLRADSHYEWRVILIGGRPGSEMRNGLK